MLAAPAVRATSASDVDADFAQEVQHDFKMGLFPRQAASPLNLQVRAWRNDFSHSIPSLLPTQLNSPGMNTMTWAAWITDQQLLTCLHAYLLHVPTYLVTQNPCLVSG